ncbi:PLD nuclease N-terminal domain-containing protein [Asanoa sp. WMMD1127]|uniref:PLD nuclease N-terminal domain-containing protein n=1 Tax=Asanoa sp. WMMD1127 TaxID=3016107 RepID=UPI0024180B57|nr:PLD nuclease N-terminal domain-containing protein [Asanoa sp. WMMD1127]MDG4823430.1 PLD nuclease N-terminal domain-containing protein [Asanoa sp. WMMD1127]
MVRLYGLLFVAQLVLAVAALISCLSADEGEIRALPRIAWVLIILFFPLVGGVAWFVAGRPEPRRAAGQWRPGSGFPESERPRQKAPDDDPEFLKSLNQRRKEDAELFEQWEADLRRREEELRKEKDDPGRG